jgi:hypothetical protein
VGVYWFGNLATAGTLTRARHRPIPAWRLHCPVCGQECIHAPCQHKCSFVADVSVEEVLTAAFEVLETTGPDREPRPGIDSAGTAFAQPFFGREGTSSIRSTTMPEPDDKALDPAGDARSRRDTDAVAGGADSPLYENLPSEEKAEAAKANARMREQPGAAPPAVTARRGRFLLCHP